MHTRAAENGNGLGTAAKEVADHASAIAKLELELAALEVKRKVVALAVGIGLGAGAALLALFGLAFLLATAGAALATALSTWLALLVVSAVLLAVAGVLGFLALGAIRKATPPLPEQAIREAKLTTDALKR
jgi:Ca2+/H+ antiporter